MNKVVVHHTYAQGVAFDVSNNRNHGLLTDVTPGTGQFERSFLFDRPSSRIDIAPAPTLEDFRAIRAGVLVFFWQPDGGPPHRHNLIEGFVSFALFIQPDGSLMGTVVDADGNSHGAVSQPGTVTPGGWHVADFIHDGINRCVLFVDGMQVGYADVRGPVRSVGPLGVSNRSLAKRLATTRSRRGSCQGDQAIRTGPLITEIHNLLDPCCADLERLRRMAGDLAADGWTKQQLLSQVDELLKLAAEAAARYRTTAGAEADHAVADSIDAMSAFRRRDGRVRGVTARAVSDRAARCLQTRPQSLRPGHAALGRPGRRPAPARPDHDRAPRPGAQHLGRPPAHAAGRADRRAHDRLHRAHFRELDPGCAQDDRRAALHGRRARPRVGAAAARVPHQGGPAPARWRPRRDVGARVRARGQSRRSRARRGDRHRSLGRARPRRDRPADRGLGDRSGRARDRGHARGAGRGARRLRGRAHPEVPHPRRRATPGCRRSQTPTPRSRTARRPPHSR